eukprot:gb/GECH01012471.1/.p1 GENE.gb/GECH01012471.1/~~gb/GECH01012471.1/.p1  ORF type:complete len:389 (+),score=99.75 gb/GECH01012471.1/:1-1167(+)
MSSETKNQEQQKSTTEDSEQSTFDGSANGMTLDERLKLILSVGEECIDESELKTLLEKKPQPTCYDGFEPSGRMHIAQGVMKALNVNKLTQAGCKFVFWVADWFAFMNLKMDGDLKRIQTVGKYMIEVWKAVGMNLDNVEFRWSSEEINKRSHEYWPLVLDVSTTFTESRITRCGQIMGRTDKEQRTASQIIYPCMQCADIFFLKADICQLGMDQRKVNMLAREYHDAMRKRPKRLRNNMVIRKPIILSHHMLMGLKEGQEKMSKSMPDTAIFMEDEASDVKKKINKAFCPPGQIERNPIAEYVQYVVFPWFGEFTVKRSEENGGDIVYKNYEDMKKDYLEEKLHPGDLKGGLIDAINRILEPVREHFKKDPQAKELLKQVRKFQKTK